MAQTTRHLVSLSVIYKKIGSLNMNHDREYQQKQISRKITKIQTIGSISPILVGLAAYGIWGADGDAFHPILNSTNVTYSMLGVGIIGMVWEINLLVPLFKERKKLTSGNDT